MSQRDFKILIVEPDPEIVEILAASFSRRFDPALTCVADAASCLDAEMLDPHDLIITESRLEESCGLELTESLMALSNRPVILLADRPTYAEASRAMSAGARAMLRKPFPVERLLDTADRLIREHRLNVRRAARYRRMRALLRRALKERRDLHRRVELVCRDLVGAQRRLVERVVSCEDIDPGATA